MGRTLDVIGSLARSISFISQELGSELERIRYTHIDSNKMKHHGCGSLELLWQIVRVQYVTVFFMFSFR